MPNASSRPDPVDSLPESDVLDALDTAKFEPRRNGKPVAGPAEVRRLSVIPLNEVGPEPPVRSLVRDLILEGDLTGFFGDGDAGKSSFLYHVAVCVACGLPVFGALEVSTPGHVLVVTSGEDRAALVRNRCVAYCRALGLSAEETDSALALVHVVDSGANLHSLEDLLALQDLLEAYPYRLLVLDPIADLIGDKASTLEDRDARLTYRHLRLFLLGILPQLAIVVVGHATKDHAEKTKRQRVFGSAAWTNGLRAGWFCERTEAGLRLDVIKGNRWAKRPTYRVAREVVVEEDGTTWRTARLVMEGADGAGEWKISDRRDLSEGEREALAALDRHRGEVVTWSRWVDVSGLRKTALSNAKARLLSLGYIAQETIGRRAGKPVPSYGITGSGLAALLDSAESAPSPLTSPPDSHGSESASPPPFREGGVATPVLGQSSSPRPPVGFEPVDPGYLEALLADGPPAEEEQAA